MTDRHSGDQDKEKNPDPADRRTDRLPVPKTGIRRHRGETGSPPIRLECLRCDCFNRLVDACHNEPEIIDNLPLPELVHRLPQLLAEQFFKILQHQFARTENNGFPCPLAEILGNQNLLAALGARLARIKNLTDLITDPPAILIDERQKLFFYRDIPIILRPITFSFLVILARTPEEFVTRDEIYRNLWPGAANYLGTDKPYEAQVSDHKRKLIAEIKQGVAGKADIAADEMETFIPTRKKLGYMLNFAKENILILRKRDILVIILLTVHDYFSDVILDMPELFFLS